MTLKTALVAPIPNASDSIAVHVKPGRLRSSRAAYRRSESKDCIATSRDRLLLVRLDDADVPRLVDAAILALVLSPGLRMAWRAVVRTRRQVDMPCGRRYLSA